MNVFFEAPQTLHGPLEDIIIFADCKAQPVLYNVGILGSEEFGRGDGGDTDLLDEEPAELKVPGSLCDVWWELVVLG